ncbi:PilW family protein [Ruicaihuangia caeni]|uniref:Prepilin-type N-terminal cleavage/methylation domain-containing protein n=1 Tax=Ruicaihuangia caeni TaxID=3042517 RepID=A0AAW6TB76_9MICO|nr:prepilin-type N-terminal cleavage/methylation domain-containing protein [Klugiella sp. YN-L-19]MDI2098550.1 prepilin-type N-terminal cleavage/methylation domain-containing protein [Klugiella sp. YN-L-19]
MPPGGVISGAVRRSTRASFRAGESGFTLIELLVYMLLSLVVLTIAGGLLINSLITQRTVADSAESTNSGQLVARAVTAAVRDAAVVRAVSGDPAILLVQVVDDARATPPTAHCEAFLVGSGEVRTTRYAGGSAPADDASVAAWLISAAGATDSWSLLATGAQPHIGGGIPAPVFTSSAPDAAAIVLDVANGDGVTVLIDTAAASRQPALTGVTPTCF